ncbi:MAG: hypothetical protein GX046_02330 [Tissierellia bacterium]|nr:hypothetical protein [Tissierellia bacterium]
MEKNISYIQIYTYIQDSQELLQVNTFSPNHTLLMQTYLKGEEPLPEENLLLFELDYPVQEEKYLSLKRSLDNHFHELNDIGHGSRILALRKEGEEILKGPKPSGEDPIFERLYDKFTRIVTYSAIPSG